MIKAPGIIGATYILRDDGSREPIMPPMGAAPDESRQAELELDSVLPQVEAAALAALAAG